MDPIVHLLHKVAAGKSNQVAVTNIGSKIFDLFQIIRRKDCKFCFFFMINLIYHCIFVI